MTSPAGSRTTSRGRIYTRRGRNYWSVTTILKNGLPAPALMNWGMRSVAEYAVANHRQIAGMLGAVSLRRAEGLIEAPLLAHLADAFGASNSKGEPVAPFYIVSDPDAIESAVRWLSGAPYRERDRKADIGSAVHAEVEALILGQPRPEPAAELAPFMAQFESWRETFAPEFLASEATVYSDRESYAGTLDMIVRIAGRTLLVDAKTGKDVYPESALQITAYSRADYIGLPDGTDEPLPAIDGGAVLHLRPDAYAFVPVRVDDEVYRAFLYAREVFRWVEETSKDAIGQPLLGPDGVRMTWPEEEVERGAA